MIVHHLHNQHGITLKELLFAIAIVGILIAIAYPSYQNSIRKSRLANVQQALLDNAQAWERYYAQHQNFRKNSRTWADLPIRETEFFCIRPQGAPRGVRESAHYSLKAVAFDKTREPRVLIMNQDLSMQLCESSTSSCTEQNYFANPSRSDKNCRSYP